MVTNIYPDLCSDNYFLDFYTMVPAPRKKQRYLSYNKQEPWKPQKFCKIVRMDNVFRPECEILDRIYYE